MNWKLPNQLTVARIGLAAGFFVLLGLYDASDADSAIYLNVAFCVYIVAGITDVLDGYFAKVEAHQRVSAASPIRSWTRCW